MGTITPQDVVKVLEGCINFLAMELLAENLTPSAEMAREENIDRLKAFTKKLQNMKSFAPQEASPAKGKQGSQAFNKLWKSENKVGLSQRITEESNKSGAIKQSPVVSKVKKSEENNSSGNNSSNNSSLSELPLPAPELLHEAELVEEDTYEVAGAGAANVEPVLQEDENYEVPQSEGVNVGDVGRGEDQVSITSNETGTLKNFSNKLKTLEKCTPEELKTKAIVSGYLRKHKKRLLTQWHKRFCVLVDEFLFYFKSETDKKEQGVIILPGYTLSVPPKEKGFVFVLESEDKTRDTYSFQADALDQSEQWQQHIQEVLDNKLSKKQIIAVAKMDIDNDSEDSGSGDSELLYDDVASGGTTSSEPSKNIPQVATSIPNVQVLPKPRHEISTPVPVPAPVPSAVEEHSLFSQDNVYMGMYDCTPDDEQDLSFNRGDVMYILEKIDTHWWLGFLNGKVGLVPSNHLTTAFVN